MKSIYLTILLLWSTSCYPSYANYHIRDNIPSLNSIAAFVVGIYVGHLAHWHLKALVRYTYFLIERKRRTLKIGT